MDQRFHAEWITIVTRWEGRGIFGLALLPGGNNKVVQFEKTVPEERVSITLETGAFEEHGRYVPTLWSVHSLCKLTVRVNCCCGADTEKTSEF
jgi:hypothetical protein